MMNILKDLYYGNINEAERDISDLQKTPEYERYAQAFDLLTDSLSKEQQKLFEDYFMNESGFSSLLHERIYANGIKVGFLLANEINDFSV